MDNQTFLQESATPAPPYSFVVMADSRGQRSTGPISEFFPIVLKRAAGFNPVFYMFGGDMVLGKYSVNGKGTGVSTQMVRGQLNDWLQIVKTTLGVSVPPLDPAIGNHDVDSNDSETAFNDVFSYLKGRPFIHLMGQGYGQTVYYFDRGNSRFIVLNSIRYVHTVDNGREVPLDQQNWLSGVLADSQATGKRFNFVMLHYPPFPYKTAVRKTGQNGQETIVPVKDSLSYHPLRRNALWHIFDQYNVTAVFVGHEHFYSRRIVDSSFSPNFTHRINQVTTGTSGAPYYPQTPDWVTDLRGLVVPPKMVYHFLVVTVNEAATPAISATAYDINGNQIDSFTLPV